MKHRPHPSTFPQSPSRSARHALSRLDLLATLAACATLAALTLPVLARTGSRSEQIGCFNNLRLIGRAMQIWGNDHDGNLPVRVPVANGGRFTGISRAGDAWLEFAWISNELVTPRILACPSDHDTRLATEFSNNPDGGLLHFNYRANALSYFLSTDSSTASPWQILSGDRNLKVSATGAGCSAGFNNAAVLNTPFSTSSDVAWTNHIHGEQGNILTADGRVAYLSTANLVQGPLAYQTYYGSLHVLMPR